MKTAQQRAENDYRNGDIPGWAVEMRTVVVELMDAFDALCEAGAPKDELDAAERDYDAACEILRKELEHYGWTPYDDGPSYLDDCGEEHFHDRDDPNRLR